MPYPKKISQETVLEAALAFIESQGLEALSMRTLAGNLGVTPNALYRYFASKAELEVAMADAGCQLLLTSLEEATRGLKPPDAMRAAAQTYIRFARRYPQLYAIKMKYSSGEQAKSGNHDAIWGFVIQLANSLPTPWDAKDLAMSLWAFLHGMVELDRANLLEGKQPEAAIEVGLDVMLAGLMARLKSAT